MKGTRRPQYDFVLNLSGSPLMARSPDTAEALGALRRFEIQRALDATERLVMRFPQEPDAHALRACAVFYGVGNLTSRDQLTETLAALDSVDPRNPTAPNIRCEVMNYDHMWQEAIKCADDLLARDDLTPAARGWPMRDRSVAKFRLGDVEGALADIKEATALDPTNHYNYKVLGAIFREAGDLDASLVSYRQSVALAPGDTGSQYGLALALAGTANWREAAAVMKPLCGASGAAEVCALHAYYLLKAGDRAEALASAQAAAPPGSTQEQTALSAWHLAKLWALAGEKSAALRFLRLSIKLEPKNPTILEEADFESLHDDKRFVTILDDGAGQHRGE